MENEEKQGKTFWDALMFWYGSIPQKLKKPVNLLIVGLLTIAALVSIKRIIAPEKPNSQSINQTGDANTAIIGSGNKISPSGSEQRESTPTKAPQKK